MTGLKLIKKEYRELTRKKFIAGEDNWTLSYEHDLKEWRVIESDTFQTLEPYFCYELELRDFADLLKKHNVKPNEFLEIVKKNKKTRFKRKRERGWRKGWK